MKLYLYCKITDFIKEQIALLQRNYDVVFIDENNFEPLFLDDGDKIIALDPDIVGWRFPNETIDKVKGLKAICLETTGYEWIDYKYCISKGIIVTNVPKYCTNAVAEKALFMALALAKRFPLFLQEGKMNWDAQFIGDDMHDAPTDIIGLGAIGTRLAEMLENIIGIKEICYFSRSNKNKKYHYMEFQDMLEKSEYMFVTLSKNDESLALFNDLSKFNKNMKVIIVANGFEEVARRLAEKCEKGELGGVAFESDDLTVKYKSNVFITPHNAYYTKAALVNMFKIWTETIIAVNTDKPVNTIK